MKQKWVKSADWFYNEATNFMEYAEIMEMMEIPSSELCQYMTPTHSFFEYISRMFTDISQRHLNERNFVLRFKQGSEEESFRAAQMVAQYINENAEMLSINRQKCLFICIPASSPEANRNRYMAFSRLVSKMTGIQNGYKYVKVNSKRAEVHAGGARSVKNYTVSDNIKGCQVIVFDDVRTTGQSFVKFASELEAMGAKVIQFISIAQAAMP